ncbi:glycosyltransferase [Chromobacterium vaccinii]|uniref:glycosyltransferase n=1 Tax=Chromobacterium vaccinii TaxID=1108595 RepID=UPI001E4967EC|nr:glycosyltransferase [Chromobacterium vaccinii]MCD4498313.1 glycosyltransferase [Chromobacterium vaccinii]
MKKILIVSDILSGFGGTEAAIARTARLLERECGAETEVFLHGRSGSGDFDWLRDTKHTIWATVVRNHKLQQFLAAWALARRIRQMRPDMVLAVTPVSCRVARWGLSWSRLRLPLVSWMHTCIGYKKQNLLLADSHLAISTDIAEQFQALGAEARDVHMVFNPVSESGMTIPRPERGAELVYVGRVNFRYQKNLQELLDGCARLVGDWRLHVVGDGQDAEICKQYAESLGIAPRVIWHGWQRDPWRYVLDEIGCASCMVLCSMEEPFGLVLVEALARGVFCVSARCVGGPRDILSDGDNGMLYSLNDVAALTACLQRVVDGMDLPPAQHLKGSVSRFHDDRFVRNFYEKLVLAEESYHRIEAK